MAAPTSYSRSYGFANFESSAPDDPKPGDQIDNELDNIATAVSSTQTALADVRRSDGGLVNGVVDRDAVGDDVFNALLDEVSTLLSWQGAWATLTAYTAASLVSYGGSSYVCVTSHTAGDFATDLAAGYWELFAAQGATGAGSGDLVSTNNLSDVADATTALSNLGGTTIGRSVFKAASTADALAAIGAAVVTFTHLTTGTGATYTPPAGVRGLIVEGVGGGGGGGGVDGQGASTCGIAGHGAGAGYFWKFIPTVDLSASYTYTIAAGGTAGAVGANNGSDGGDTSFTDGTLSLTAYGGGGGYGHTAIATSAGVTRGSAGTASGGDFNLPGETPVVCGIVGGVPGNLSRAGGSWFGPGATPASSNAPGVVGPSPGSGGSGATVWGEATNRAGGAGADGYIRITEIY